MTRDNIRLPSGSTVALDGDRVTLFHPDAPEDANGEVGRVVGGAFQPVPFCVVGMFPSTLRAIATLIEERTD